MSRAPNLAAVALSVCSAIVFLVVHATAEAAAPGDDRIVVAGKCVDEHGSVVAGAKVRLFRVRHEDGGMSIIDFVNGIKSGADGTFRFADVRAPLHDSSATKWITHYVIATRSGLASAAGFVDRERGSGEMEMVLGRAGRLHGVVKDKNGMPVQGAAVYRPCMPGAPLAGVWSAVTDNEGRYAIDDLPEWDANSGQPVKGEEALRVSAYYFFVLHPDYGKKAALYSRIPSEVDVILDPAAIIEGLVIDSVTGKPAAGVTVQAQGIGQRGFAEAVSDAEGRYQLRSLDADRYNVWATASERTVKAIDSFAVAAGETKQAPDLELISGGFITGRVLHFETGEPLSRAADGRRIRIGLYGPSKPSSGAAIESVVVADDGTYRIRVAPGENRPYLQMLRVVKQTSRPGYISVAEGETIELDFYVDPKGQARARR